MPNLIPAEPDLGTTPAQRLALAATAYQACDLDTAKGHACAVICDERSTDRQTTRADHLVAGIDARRALAKAARR